MEGKTRRMLRLFGWVLRLIGKVLGVILIILVGGPLEGLGSHSPCHLPFGFVRAPFA